MFERETKRRRYLAFHLVNLKYLFILTHLFFNPQARTNNVFIVDEPELSLHVQWQELYVESLTEASPNIQYIMATHSPSIILDRTSRCVDVKPSIHPAK